LRKALREIRAQADVVVIEAPPLVSPDALPLADNTEMILLIADARKSTRAQVRAAMRELDQERAKLTGCVLVSVGLRRRLKPTFLGLPRPTVRRRTDHAARQ
jgi:Mrp family chromosome partitioning ATPase